MKSVIGSKRKSTQKISSFNINSKKIINEQHIANEFNNYFISVGPTLAENLPPTDLNHLEFVRCNANSMVIFHIDLNEVITVINSLKNSSPGYDGIPATLAKRVINSYIKPLTHYSLSFFLCGKLPR